MSIVLGAPRNLTVALAFANLRKEQRAEKAAPPEPAAPEKAAKTKPQKRKAKP